MSFERPTISELRQDYQTYISSLVPEANAVNNWSAYSRIRNHGYAVVRLIDDLYANVEFVLNDIWFDTASEGALENYLIDRGLIRGSATKSTVTLRIGSKTLPTSTIVIYQLFQVSTDDDEPKIFQTTESKSISPATPMDGKGYYTVEMQAESFIAGQDQNVVAEAINQIVTVLPGIDVVYNLNESSGGTDQESKENMIERLKDFMNPSPNTKEWYENEAKNFSFIKDAIAMCSDEGSGHVGLYIAGYGALTPTQIQEVEDYFNDASRSDCGANVVTVIEIAEVDIDIEITVSRLSESITAAMILTAITNYFNAYMVIGKDFVLQQLEAYIYNNVNYIYDVTITLPTANIIIPINKIGVKGLTPVVLFIDVEEE